MDRAAHMLPAHQLAKPRQAAHPPASTAPPGSSAAPGSDPTVDGESNSGSRNPDGAVRAAQNRTKNAGIRKVARRWKRYG
jgi:CBS domain-containing protein